MLNHLRLFYIYIAPVILLTLIGAIPEFLLLKKKIAIGHNLQYFLFEYFLKPILFLEDTRGIEQWFETASYLKRLGLHFFLSLNINILMLPVLFGLAAMTIKFSTWMTVTDMNLLRDQIKK